MAETPLIRLTGIAKSYPGVKALKGVDFSVMPGTIHCLVGENGAGKSTLMRVIAGAIRPDAGSIEIDGESLPALDPASAMAHGIGIIYQELDLVPAMSVAENIFLGHEPRTRLGLLDRRAMQNRAGEILTSFDLPIAPDALVRDLGPAQRQLVQIARTLSHDNRLLILDEPTATLTDNEVEHLFALLDRFRQQGVGIVYISHRLEEVLRMGDTVTVMRDGTHIVTRTVAGLARHDLIEAMVGRRIEDTAPRPAPATGVEALAVEGLTRAGEFADICLRVREGEVLGLAGLVGAGRSEVLETIFGLRRADSGTVRLQGRNVTIRDSAMAVRLGLGLVPEERRASGLITSQSVADNLVLPMVDRLSGPLGLRQAAIDRLVATQIAGLKIKTASPATRSGLLSGGNQQKIVIGKWLAAGVRVLLLDEPTRGVDVGAKEDIYRLIAQLSREGVAVVVASSELPEILGITDRVLVLARGRQTALLETARTSPIEIMRHAFGETEALAYDA